MCKVLTILVLVLLLTLTSDAYNVTLLKSLLSLIANREPWINTPIFVGHHTQSGNLNDLIIWLHQTMGVTSLTMNSFLQAEHLRPLGNFKVTRNNAIVLFFCYDRQDVLWLTLDRNLRQLRRIRLIIILRSQRSGSQKAIKSIFNTLWQYQFLNVLVLHRDQLYSYTPYPALSFFKLDIYSEPLFPPAARNFQGYVVSTPAENDIPRVFHVHDASTKSRKVLGYAYRTFVEYINHYNASLRLTNPDEDLDPTTSVNMNRIVQLIIDGQLEISLHPYVFTPPTAAKSYPLMIYPNCLIVPMRNEIPRHMYLLRPFQLYSWYLLLFAVIYITGVLYWISPKLDKRTRTQRLGLHFLDAISKILFISSPTTIHRPTWRHIIIFLQLCILGFISTSWYNIELDSFFTTIVVGEQVNSMDQLVRQQQKVLVKEYEFNTLLRHVEPRLVDKVSRLLVAVNASEQVSALLSFNRSFAYPFTEERWQFFAMQQQYAFKPIFRFSSACLGSPHIGYPMRVDSHLESSLNHFILMIQDTGLLNHWVVSDFNDAMRAGYVRFLDNVLGYQGIDVDTLRLGWCVLGIGWMLSALVFSCEYWHIYPWRFTA
ncbi:uncharacterized protein LOC6549031 [Drosophila erecta]|uniref:Ionotropic glutamate receptor C-terminal domain-containing protein n=1 Tax=Drosophila erecta TaxID=7220 RepID=B3NQN0_DROER|nr:uncharacterized protein LOC6549031 [Drosophila erecta]EDV55940.1 uncharacterized protein Dere_GG20503 [Drosophila erecta]